MNKVKSFFVISRFNEDISWIKEYTNDYIIYNKGKSLGKDYKEEMDLINVGGNVRDPLKFIVDNYNNLPELVAFLQGNPYESRVTKERFDKLIQNNYFTCIEAESFNGQKEYIEGNGLIDSYDKERPIGKKLTIDVFMNIIFKNYIHLDKIKFSNGAQYLVERERILYYTKSFWQYLLSLMKPSQYYDKLPYRIYPSILMERILWLIYMNKYEQREIEYLGNDNFNIG